LAKIVVAVTIFYISTVFSHQAQQGFLLFEVATNGELQITHRIDTHSAEKLLLQLTDKAVTFEKCAANCEQLLQLFLTNIQYQKDIAIEPIGAEIEKGYIYLYFIAQRFPSAVTVDLSWIKNTLHPFGYLIKQQLPAEQKVQFLNADQNTVTLQLETTALVH